jgi:hypothetical protein
VARPRLEPLGLARSRLEPLGGLARSRLAPLEPVGLTSGALDTLETFARRLGDPSGSARGALGGCNGLQPDNSKSTMPSE